MKTYNTPWSTGSIFICSKCGGSFDNPEMAEKLKTELRIHLKDQDGNKKIRVMVSGCLNVCIDNEQAVVYQPVSGVTETFTIGSNLEENIQEMKGILGKKLERV